MKVVNSSEMAQIDQETQNRFKFPALLLMENAGLKIYSKIKNILHSENLETPCVFLVGKGNNGGDALVIARQFFNQGWKNIFIILVNGIPPEETLAGKNLSICKALNINIVDYKQEKTLTLKLLAKAKYIIDGILGTGISGEVQDSLKDLIGKVNKYPGIKIAIDIPTGIGDFFKRGYTAFHADYTFTVELPKLCLYLPYARSYCGKIIPVKIGFPESLIDNAFFKGELLSNNDFFKLLPRLPSDVHKSQRGHCAVFAGSVGTTGAAHMCASGAARTRLGLVTLFAADNIYPLLAPKFSSVMIRPLSTADVGALDFKKRFSGLLIGPGWGIDADKDSLLESLIATGLPGVLDADGLSILARILKKKKIVFKQNMVLTPHPGEFIRLYGGNIEDLLNNPLPNLLDLSSRLNTPIILKGHVSFLVSPEGGHWILDGMNPALATGGSGDVLAGIIAGFIAGGLEVINACKCGLILQARLAEYVFNKCGWFLSEDLIPFISKALKQTEDNPIWQ